MFASLSLSRHMWSFHIRAFSHFGTKTLSEGSNCVSVEETNGLLFYVWGQCVMINGLQLQFIRQSSLVLAFFLTLCPNDVSDKHKRKTEEHSSWMSWQKVYFTIYTDSNCCVIMVWFLLINDCICSETLTRIHEDITIYNLHDATCHESPCNSSVSVCLIRGQSPSHQRGPLRMLSVAGTELRGLTFKSASCCVTKWEIIIH